MIITIVFGKVGLDDLHVVTDRKSCKKYSFVENIKYANIFQEMTSS